MQNILAEWHNIDPQYILFTVGILVAAGVLKSDLKHIAKAVEANTEEMKEHRETSAKQGASLASHEARLDGHDIELRDLKGDVREASGTHKALKGR